LKRLARRSALSIKANDKAILVLEDLNFKGIKTKNFTSVLKSLDLENKKSLFVLGELNNNVYLSSRNLKGTEVITSSELSTYKIMATCRTVISRTPWLTPLGEKSRS
jgi:large subunit ribosomal protein L4